MFFSLNRCKEDSRTLDETAEKTGKQKPKQHKKLLSLVVEQLFFFYKKNWDTMKLGLFYVVLKFIHPQLFFSTVRLIQSIV